MEALIFPTEALDPVSVEPRNLCLYGLPGIGKTPIAATLPRAGYIDCQGGSRSYKCQRADILALAEKHNMSPWVVYELACAEFKRQGVDFIIVDTIGEVGDWADGKALAKFQDSPLGKAWNDGMGFNESSILDLPGQKGSAGFGRLREAFKQLLAPAMGLNHHAIFIGHPRDTIAFATGADPNVKEDTTARSTDLDLLGKMRYIFTSQMDAVGYMYRDWDEKRIMIKFTPAGGGDAFCRTRCPYLAGMTLWFSNPCKLEEWARIYPVTLSKHLLDSDRAHLEKIVKLPSKGTANTATT